MLTGTRLVKIAVLLALLCLLFVCALRLCKPWKLLKSDVFDHWERAPTMEETRKYVNVKIMGKKVVVFSKSYCPYCKEAIAILEGAGLRQGADMDVIQIENVINASDIQDYLLQLTGQRSVPRIFINGKCVGGSDDLKRLQKSGQLREKLLGH